MKKLLISFMHAIDGIKYSIKTQRNMRIHFVITLCVAVLGYLLNLNSLEWAIVLLVINTVIVSELINTALENVIDLVTEEYKLLAKIAKDVAAGAVLISAIFSVIIGLLIFYPKIF